MADFHSRVAGALFGSAIGDALAMPVHWYYDRESLRRDYGFVDTFLRPRNPHPDSILWRSKYQPFNEKADILHDQARYWGQRGIHYHQFLQPGEVTLTGQLANLLQESLLACNGYDSDDYLQRYLGFLGTPGAHRDTYVEECHRGFFQNFARGKDLRQCGIPEKHIGGLAGIVPIATWYADQPDEARLRAHEHVSLTHPGEPMQQATDLVLDLLLPVLQGGNLLTAIEEIHRKQSSPFLGFPLSKFLKKSDEAIIGPKFSPACYVEDSVPAVIYLAAKYHDQPEKGLVANTNLGGDNVHRGAILGALLGAGNGVASWPADWIGGLVESPPLLVSDSLPSVGMSERPDSDG